MGNFLTDINRVFRNSFRRLGLINSSPPFQKQDRQVENILENITDGFFAVDSNWIVQYYNKAAENILLPRDLIINKNLWDVFSDAVGSRFYNEYHRVMNEGVTSSFEEYYPRLELWVQINAYPAENGISIFFRDITESKRQLRLKSLEKDVLTLYTSKGSTIESTIQLMLDGIQRIHPDLLCSLLKVSEGEFCFWTFSHLPASYLQAANQIGPPGFFTKKRVTSDIANDPEWVDYKELAASYGLKAYVSYPLTDPYQRVLGIFTVYLKTPRALKPAEEASLERAKYILQHILENYIAEEIVKASEGKYRDLFHQHPLPLWLYDTETFAFLDVNEAAIRQYGYSRTEFLGMSIRDIRPDEDLPFLEKQLQTNKATGDFSVGMFRHKKKNGKLIHVEVRGNEIDFNGIKARLIISIDMTEKVKVEQALNLSEKRFKALVQEGSDLINIIDLNGVYKYASPASATMIGLNTEDVTGTNAFNFIHEEDREMIIRSLSEIASTKRVQTPPFRFKDQGGGYRWLQSIGTNLLDDPAVEGIVVNSKDITESIQYIHAIEEQNTKFRDIAWTQSHVVRSPLSRLMGLINLIAANPDNQPLNAELLEHLLTSAHELDGIIRDIVRKTELVDRKG